MKRIITILLSISMLLSLGLSSACAHEIEFRNMDWLISLDEFEKSLTNDGISFKYDYNYTKRGYSIDSWVSFEGTQPHWRYDNVPQYCMRYHSKNNDYLCSVGGYEASAIYGKFLPHHNSETGYIAKSGGAFCDLVRASYQLYGKKTSGEYVSVEKCYQDMVSKLQVVYGAPSGNTKSTYTQTTYWHKNDGSAVSVSLTKFGVAEWVMIDYAWTLEKDYVMQLNEIVNKKDAQEVVSNLEGL